MNRRKALKLPWFAKAYLLQYWHNLNGFFRSPFVSILLYFILCLVLCCCSMSNECKSAPQNEQEKGTKASMVCNPVLSNKRNGWKNDSALSTVNLNTGSLHYGRILLTDVKGTNGRQKTYEIFHVYCTFYSGFMC